MRREDLLNPDLMSEVIVLAAGVLVFVIWLLILVAALTPSRAGQKSEIGLPSPSDLDRGAVPHAEQGVSRLQ